MRVALRDEVIGGSVSRYSEEARLTTWNVLEICYP